MSAATPAGHDRAGPSQQAAAAAAACDYAVKGAELGAELPVMLSPMRRADVSEYRGKLYVNVREYYSVQPRDALLPLTQVWRA